ncbi:KICSTOR subunit 2-like isoform X2 [Mya arenaria]|uniref:KICSTOR subunit 2-like isoform X2 n=1 Tax=Mya arenaria TaxID=6604 RepID=UPI0022E0BDD8|nr:KICSTOR subunit 2-like isoform X2 [Mya arenaria]
MSLPTTPGSPPGAKESGTLQTYFQALGQFAYDKAKELMDKEKEIHKATFGSSWGLMVHTLSQFATAEKTYNSLGFLEQKWFGRPKDTLRNSYLVLLQELRRMEEAVRQQDSVAMGMPGPGADFEILLSHLCGQLCEYIRARQKTMDFYEQISLMGTNKNMNYQDLVEVIAEIIHVHSRNFHHPILASLKSGFTSECDIVSHLLQAQLLMAEGQFLPSLLQLHQAHSKLTSWGAASQARETVKKGMFGSTTKTLSSLPALYSWLLRYKCLLVAKFSLYFYDVLSKQTTSVDMKGLSAKNCEDYVAKVTAFQKKSDASHVCLVLDTQGLESPYRGPGYTHPDRQGDTPKGLDSYPTIFSFPGAVQSTYFITSIEPRIYLVVIYETKKSEKDSYVNSFMLELSSLLRCIKHFAGLKPGSRVGGSRK